MVLLCWIECSRPTFFSLTTGACELTSSLPWERNCRGKANALASPPPPPFYCPSLLLVCVSVSSCPHFCPVCASSVFGSFILSLPHCVQHMVTLFSLFQKRYEKHLGDAQSRHAVKILEQFLPSREILIENSGGTTNKRRTCKLGNEQMQCDMQP